jgi:hypothetical protein
MLLYKYIVPARAAILETGLIRFTQPAALNDPFELRPYFESLVPADQLEALLRPTRQMIETELKKAYKELSSRQRRGISEKQFLNRARQSPELLNRSFKRLFPMMARRLSDLMPEMRERLGDEFAERYGILSLSEVSDDVLMWSHYAANHAGLVLAFNDTDPFFDRRRRPDDDFYHLRQVHYVSGDQSRSLAELGAGDIFFSKGAGWSQEREWRMVIPLVNPDERLVVDGDSIYLYRVPPTAIAGVIVGAKAHKGLLETVRSILNADPRLAHVTLKKAQLDQRTRQLVITDLDRK